MIKKIKENYEIIIILTCIIGMLTYIGFLIYDSERYNNEKECWDYYLKNNIKLKTCRMWFNDK